MDSQRKNSKKEKEAFTETLRDFEIPGQIKELLISKDVNPEDDETKSRIYYLLEEHGEEEVVTMINRVYPDV